jgi:phosphoribosylformimino-5-aminoimidazole carboxamide ribotide isomerase
VLEGRAVRLHEGVRDRIAIEGGDPVALARRFVGDGAAWLHLVDLDGAFAGRPSPTLVARIAAIASEVPIQVGGGYRSIEAVEAALEAGATRVIVGTAALAPGFLVDAATRFADRLVVAIDARDGRVAVEGWTQESPLRPGELASRCADAGVRRLLVTSTRRDGSLAGPDLELLAEVVPSGIPVLAAGGIASVDDVLAVRDAGCEGGVVGSALWKGSFTVRQALDALAAQ